MRHPLSFPDISIFHQKVAIFVILGKKLKLHFYIKFVTTAAFFEFIKVILINAIVILMMSAILANQGFILKKSFWSHDLCPSWWHHRQYFITWRTLFCIYMWCCSIWYHLYNLKNLKNTHGGVLLLVKLQTSACNFTKSNAPPWVFSRFLNCTNSTKSRIASHTIMNASVIINTLLGNFISICNLAYNLIHTGNAFSCNLET